MDLKHIEAEWEKDSMMNPQDPNPLGVDQLHSKYWRYLSQARQELIPLNEEMDKLRFEKMQFFLNPTQEVATTKKWNPGKWNPSAGKLTKSDLKEFVDADKDVLDLQKRISKIEVGISFIEDIIKKIHNRSFLINAHIEWEKFKHGVK